MFTAAEKALILQALEDEITRIKFSQKKSRLPEMLPVFEKHISVVRALVEKVRGIK